MGMKTIIVWLVSLALGSVSSAEAQQPAKIPRIGFLGATFPSADAARNEAFRQGLRDLGYVEGKNIVIEYRWAEGKFDRLPDLAAELVRLKVDVIVTGGPASTPPAKEATVTIPIVCRLIVILLATGLSPALRDLEETSRACPKWPPSWRENGWSS